MGEFAAFCVGVALGAVMMAIMIVGNDESIQGSLKAVEQCELELPRDQHCVSVITAVPKSD